MHLEPGPRVPSALELSQAVSALVKRFFAEQGQGAVLFAPNKEDEPLAISFGGVEGARALRRRAETAFASSRARHVFAKDAHDGDRFVIMRCGSRGEEGALMLYGWEWEPAHVFSLALAKTLNLGVSYPAITALNPGLRGELPEELRALMPKLSEVLGD